MALLSQKLVAGRVPTATQSTRTGITGHRIAAARLTPTVLHRGSVCRAAEGNEAFFSASEEEDKTFFPPSGDAASFPATEQPAFSPTSGEEPPFFRSMSEDAAFFNATGETPLFPLSSVEETPDFSVSGAPSQAASFGSASGAVPFFSPSGQAAQIAAASIASVDDASASSDGPVALLEPPPGSTIVPGHGAGGGGGGGGADSAAGSSVEGEMSGAEIKAALLDSLYGTERGLAARSEVRAEINELITQLEAKNPSPNPTDSMQQLDGNWKLVYTSSPVLISILALGRLPLVTIGDLTQYIDTNTNTVENKFQIQGPLSSTSFSTTASFEVRSPKRLQFKLERGTISTPSLVQDIEIPPSISILGQNIDLTDFSSVLKPLSEGLGGLLAQAGNLISQAPDLNIPLQSEKAQTWQLNTYVDDDLRIMRGDGGAVFIAVKL